MKQRGEEIRTVEIRYLSKATHSRYQSSLSMMGEAEHENSVQIQLSLVAFYSRSGRLVNGLVAR